MQEIASTFFAPSQKTRNDDLERESSLRGLFQPVAIFSSGSGEKYKNVMSIRVARLFQPAYRECCKLLDTVRKDTANLLEVTLHFKSN